MFESRNVYALIAAVSGEVAKIGISKTRKNVQQGYAFRGIDEVLNTLAPLLASHGLVILPRVLTREVTERSTVKGGVLFSVVVEAEFDLVSMHDGSQHCVRFVGEAMDSGDKATNKAMSAAYKYMALQTFCIPTEGDDHDADFTTHDDVLPRFPNNATQTERPTNGARQPSPAAGEPANFAETWSTLQAVAQTGMGPLGKAFTQLDPATRAYLTKGYSGPWEALRKQAVAVTAAGEVS